MASIDVLPVELLGSIIASSLNHRLVCSYWRAAFATTANGYHFERVLKLRNEIVLTREVAHLDIKKVRKRVSERIRIAIELDVPPRCTTHNIRLFFRGRKGAVDIAKRINDGQPGKKSHQILVELRSDGINVDDFGGKTYEYRYICEDCKKANRTERTYWRGYTSTSCEHPREWKLSDESGNLHELTPERLVHSVYQLLMQMYMRGYIALWLDYIHAYKRR